MTLDNKVSPIHEAISSDCVYKTKNIPIPNPLKIQNNRFKRGVNS